MLLRNPKGFLHRSQSHQPHLQRQETPEEAEFDIKVQSYRSLSACSDYGTMSKQSSQERRQDSLPATVELTSVEEVMRAPGTSAAQSEEVLRSSSSVTQAQIPASVWSFSVSLGVDSGSSIELELEEYQGEIQPSSPNTWFPTADDVEKDFSLPDVEEERFNVVHDEYAMQVLLCENVARDPQLICEALPVDVQEIDGMMSRMREEGRDDYIAQEIRVSGP